MLIVVAIRILSERCLMVLLCDGMVIIGGAG